MATVIFFFLIFAIIASITWWTIRNGISPMPTSKKVKQALLQVLPQNVTGEVVDLGSGFGTLAFFLSKRYPKCRVIGYETSPIPYFISLIIKMITGNSQVHFIRKNFFSVSHKNASMVVCYLYPGAMKKLQVKLNQELKPGTWVISHTFALPNWKPIEVFHVKDLYRTKIYLYKKG